MKTKVILSVRVLVLAAGFLGVLGLFATGMAADEPLFKGRTIRIIVPVAPGGGMDLQSRLLARLLPRYIPGGPSVIVQNMPGAGGIVAANFFSRMPAPEVTILQGHIAYSAYQLLGREIEYDVRRWHILGGAARPFQPVIQRAALPYASVREWAQAKDPINWGAIARGDGVANVAQAMSLAAARIHIVGGYLGEAPRATALLRGEIDATTLRFAIAKPHLDAGQLRVVGRLTPGEIPGYPEAPYVSEAFDFSEEQRALYEAAAAPYRVEGYWIVRKDTPQQLVRAFRDAVKLAITSVEYQSAADRMQLGGDYMSAEEIDRNFIRPQLGMPPDLQKKFRTVMLRE